MSKRKVDDLYYKLSLEDRAYKAGWSRAHATTKTGTAGIKRTIGTLGPTIAAAFSVAAITRFGKATLDAYGEQERAERTLSAAMKQASTYSEEAYQHNLQYAASLQKITTYGDEAILGVQKMLSNFGVEGEMMDKLTRATLNLAAAKGMDLKAAADLVAKSVGSSTNALTRYGIKVEGAVGSTERMEMAVDNITKIFGGSAAAEADTYKGKVEQMKNSTGDLAEAIGAKLAPTMGTLAEKIGEVSEAATGYLKKQDAPFSATVGYLNEEIGLLEKKIAIHSKLAFLPGRAEKVKEMRTELAYLKEGLVEARGIQGALASSSASTGAVTPAAVTGGQWLSDEQVEAQTSYLSTAEPKGILESERGNTAEMYAEKVALEQEHLDALFEMHQGHVDREAELNNALAENTIQNQQAMQSAKMDYYSAWASLAHGIGAIVGKENKAVFLALKATDMAMTWMNTLTGAQLAVATIPPPKGEIVAAARLAAGKVRVAAIGATAIAGMRAEGGPVSMGQTYIVGERGPELLTMGGNGHVASNEDSFGGGDINLSLSANIQCLDSRSIEDLLDDNPDALLSVIKGACKRGDDDFLDTLRAVL